MACQTLKLLGQVVTMGYSLTCEAPYTAFAQVVDITGNRVTSPEIVVTELNDEAVKTQPGTPDYGEVTVRVRYDKSQVSLIMGWIANKTILGFQLLIDETTGADSEAVFTGWVKDFDWLGTAQHDQQLEGTLTIRITGASDFTAGS